MACRTVGELLESLVKMEVWSEQADKVRGNAGFDNAVVRAAAACNRIFRTRDIDRLVLYCRASGCEFNHRWLAEQHAKLIVDGGVDRSEVDAMSLAEFLVAIDDRWDGPKSPADWRRQFGRMAESTFSRHVKANQIRVKTVTTKSILIHRDDVARFTKTHH